MPLELRPFALERWFAPREFVARHHLSSSDCEPLALDEVIATANTELRDAWRDLKLGYCEARGWRLLREEIAPLHDVDADQVLCLTPSEGITLAMMALLEPGDVVVVAMPAYQSLFEVARAQGCTVRAWMPREDPWRFDPDDLRALVDGAKLVVVNFPHNPTGAHPTPDEWRKIGAVVDSAGAWLFSDEMYRFLEPHPSALLPSATSLCTRAIALSGLSKSFSAPGLRAGWLACKDAALLERIAALKDYTTICGNAVGELVSLMVLGERERILADNRARIAKNAAAVDALVARIPSLSWTRPRAGSTALLRFADRSARELSDAIFHERSVLLLPSTVFDFGDRHARLGLGRDAFATSLDELAAFLG